LPLGTVLYLSLLVDGQLLVMTPLIILPQPAAAEMQGLWEHLLLQAMQDSSNTSNGARAAPTALEESASSDGSSTASWDAREAAAHDESSADSLDAEVFVYANSAGSSNASGSHAGPQANDQQQQRLLAAERGWHGVIAPLVTDLAYLLGLPAFDEGDTGRSEVLQKVVAGAARLGLWELVLFLVQTLEIALAVVGNVGGEGVREGKAQKLQPQPSAVGRGPTWQDDEREKPSSSSSRDAGSQHELSSGGAIGRTANADAVASNRGDMAPSNSSDLVVPSWPELLLKGGGCWPADLERQYLSFKQSQLTVSDTCVLLIDAAICSIMIISEWQAFSWLPPLFRSAPLLGPLASKLYIAAATLLPCMALVLSHFAYGRQGELRESCAVLCAWNSAAVTVPLALGWIAPVEAVIKLSSSISFMMEAASLFSNGLIRPCAFQVREGR
jgi:hypothetical protein